MNTEVQRFRFDVLVFGKPQMAVYAFFVDGLLIDTGHSRAKEQALKTLTPLPIEQIFISHHHEDHTGNLKAIQDRLTVPIYAHPLCAEIMKNPPKVCFIERKTWGENTAVSNIIPIEKTIETNNYTFELIHTPGHSDDHLCLFEPNEGWLFTGDLYVHHYIRYFMETESVAGQILSLKKLLQLDFKQIYCSHNPIEKDGRAQLQRKLQFFEDFYGNVATLHQKGQSPKAIMHTLGMKEKWMLRLLSSGWLSSINMVKSAIRDLSVL